MTTSATQDFLSDVLQNGRIPDEKLAYFQARLASRFHQAMLKAFEKLERDSGLSRKVLARRIGRSPEQITRWFSYPGNLTLGTVSDIFIGLGCEIEALTLVDLASGKRTHCPEAQVDWSRLNAIYLHEAENPADQISERRPCNAGAQAEVSRALEVNSFLEDWVRPSARTNVISGQSVGRAEAAQFQLGRALPGSSIGALA
jgi:hypothetical protein